MFSSCVGEIEEVCISKHLRGVSCKYDRKSSDIRLLLERAHFPPTAGSPSYKFSVDTIDFIEGSSIGHIMSARREIPKYCSFHSDSVERLLLANSKTDYLGVSS